ncbi:MAG: alpha-L-fucosidase [bacterium]
MNTRFVMQMICNSLCVCSFFPGHVAAGSDPTRLALPTLEQIVWQDYEIGMFIHFSMNTWQDQEYDDLSTPLSQFNPRQLDTDQWVNTAVNMGAKYIVFVAKHVGGFCMWPTKTTDYSVENTPWRNGKGDVLADLAESCRKCGIRLGVYLSPADRKYGATVGGRCETKEAQEEYGRIYREQLTEVLSQYGEMVEVWFDGSLVVDVGDILAEYAPRAMIFQGPHATIRWVGNESGYAPYPAWNSVRRIDGESGVATAVNGDPYGSMWLPLECDARMRKTWFWSSNNADTLKTVEELMDMYYLSVGRGATLLLNHTPDPSGLIPEADAARASEFQEEIQKRFGRSVAETSGVGPLIELDLGSPTTIDHAIIMEDIAFGERVREYVIEGERDGNWEVLCSGTSIGHKKIDPFDPITVSKVRFRAIQSVSQPLIRKLSVYDTNGAYSKKSIDVSVWEAPRDKNEVIVIWEWDEHSITEDWQTVKIDIGQYCKEAGQYSLEFRADDGELKGLEIDSVILMVDNQDAPEFVKSLDRPGLYRISISGIDRTMDLRIRLRRVGERVRSGKLFFNADL